MITLHDQVREIGNDYQPLEMIYRLASAGGELVRDPYASVRYQCPELKLSASVAIPAWNAQATLPACIRAIELSSFNRRYPEQLEVIVVDDGSVDNTWRLLECIQPQVRLRALRQQHLSRAHAQNTAISVAEGQVVISCDADMVLAPFAIEELVKRHQILGEAMLLGFRSDTRSTDPRVRADTLGKHLPLLLPPFLQDIRLNYGAGGWPENMCRDTDHLQRLGHGHKMLMADGSRWGLASMVYGALFSLLRTSFQLMDGYDERFFGWGCEDTLVGARAIALGLPVVPVYSAAGLHIEHGDRSPRKWQEFAANQRVLQSILHQPFVPGEGRWLRAARGRIRRSVDRAPRSREGPPDAEWLTVYEHALSDPDTRGTYLNTIGRFQEAADSFAGVDGTCEQRALAVFKRGKALRAASRCYEAAELLEDAAHRLPTYAEPRIELALARASLGSYYAARDELHYARELEPDNSTIRFLISRSARQHLERARFYSAQGDHALAARDCEAALLMEPTDWDAILTHGRNLALLGRTEAAHDALARYVLTDHASAVVDVRGLLELADTQLALGDLGAAKVALERAARLQPHEPRIHERRARIDRAAANKYPVLSASQIVQLTQAIPGWFWPEESELLIGLALRAAANAGRIQPPQFVEIGSYCGRSTIALGLVLKMLRKTLGRVIAVDDPTLGPAPDGRTARSVLREHLAAHELEKVVLLAPEEDAQPELRDFQLVLVDGQHDEAHVEADIKTYSSRLTRGGLLAFHDYADYFPDVQRSVDRLLLNSEFAFVAHVRSLIALERRDAL